MTPSATWPRLSTADGRIDLRMPDAVGNLFKKQDRSGRKYGPAGQLLESQAENGTVTRYEYDAEGNLLEKSRRAPPRAMSDLDLLLGCLRPAQQGGPP